MLERSNTKFLQVLERISMDIHWIPVLLAICVDIHGYFACRADIYNMATAPPLFDFSGLSPGDTRGPPCFAQVSKACKDSNGMRTTSQYQFVPEEKLSQYGLPDKTSTSKAGYHCTHYLQFHRQFHRMQRCQYVLRHCRIQHVVNLCSVSQRFLIQAVHTFTLVRMSSS